MKEAAREKMRLCLRNIIDSAHRSLESMQVSPSTQIDHVYLIEQLRRIASDAVGLAGVVTIDKIGGERKDPDKLQG